MLLPLIKQPQTTPTEEVNQSAVSFLNFLQALPQETVGESYCTSPLNIQGQLPFWINQNYGSNTGEQYLVSFLQAYYNWMYCGFKKEDINLTPYDIEELLNIDLVPDIFLDEYVKTYAPFITPAAIRPEDRQNLRKFLRSIKTDFLINKGTENSYRYLLKILFNVSDVTIDYPKKYLMRLNGGKYIGYSWDISGATGIIDLPFGFNPDSPVGVTGVIAGGVGYNTTTRPNLYGAALNEAVLPDDYFWQEHSYLLTSDAPNDGPITYKDTLLAGAHPAGMLGFFEQYIPLVDTDSGSDNNGEGVVTNQTEEMPVIGRYLLMNPGITFTSQPENDVEGCVFYNQYDDISDNCSAAKNYSCYCCTHDCDPYGVAVRVPQHKVPSWDLGVINDVRSSDMAHMTIESFKELDSANASSPNILFRTCDMGQCAFCIPGVDNPAGISGYSSELNLFRFVDADIYGFMIERNQNASAIDATYPEFPYVSSANGFTGFGNLYENVNVFGDLTNWDTNLEGTVFMGGALGKNQDSAGKLKYIDGLSGSVDPRDLAIKRWVEGLSTVPNQIQLNSFYDIGDSSRRGLGSRKVPRSSIKKYQWFDFAENEVMGSNNQSIAAGYQGSTIIAPDFTLTVPRTGYTVTADRTSSIYRLLLKAPTKSELLSIKPELVTNCDVTEIYTVNRVRLKSIDQSVDQTVVMLDENGSIRILHNTDSSAEATISGAAATDAESYGWLTYFDKDYIANGFLTDDTGNSVFIENVNFVSVVVTGGLLGTDIYVWCLHKSGKLYGVNLTGTVTGGSLATKKPKFSSGTTRHPSFGTAGTFTSSVVANHSGSNLLANLGYDPYEQIFVWNGNTNTGVPRVNGMCKEIAYVLNLIPKTADGIRFPVTSVLGGYTTGGIAVCVDPNYTGYLPTNNDNFLHPTQMCEIVKFMDGPSSVPFLRQQLKKIQRYSAIYNSTTRVWSYQQNLDFDKELYDVIFGVTITVDGVPELMYVPPRCVSINRVLSDPNASPSTGTPGTISIMSNNGNWCVITAGNSLVVPCRFNSAYGVSASNENLSITQQFNKNKINLLGDLNSSSANWDYTKYGPSVIYNGLYGYIGNFYTKLSTTFPTPRPVIIEDPQNFNGETTWPGMGSQVSPLSMGWGNPMKVDGNYNSNYQIAGEDANSDNILGFSYYDYFGNTGSDNNAGAALHEQNYINNNHIVKVIGYKDHNGNLPVLSNGTVNTAYDFRGAIPVLSVGDHEKLDNPFAWIRAVADIIYGIRFDGTVDIISKRSADLDGYVWDPWIGGSWPSNRRNASGITFDTLRPAGYTADINTMKKVGSYVNRTYEAHGPYNLPFIFTHSP